MAQLQDQTAIADIAAQPVTASPSDTLSDTSPAVSASRYWTLVSSHAIIDLFPVMLTTLLWPLQERLNLSAGQLTFVLMATPLFSGLTQPVLARITDKHNTRLCGPLGLAIGALCIGSIGLAQTFWQLIALQIVGVIAIGMYHPISTAVAGQVGTRLLRNGRAQAIGVFISSGMVGHAVGAKLGPAINAMNDGDGMIYLMWFIPPALIVAILLHFATRHVSHRHDNHAEIHANFAPGESALRWRTIIILTIQNALRFTVNVGLLAIMLNVWPKSKLIQSGAFAEASFPNAHAAHRALASQASLHAGSLAAALTIGMGLSVILSGRFIKRGNEWAPLIYFSIIGAVFTALLGPLADFMHARGGFGFMSMLPVYICTALTSIGFFATFPIATSLAQRLQPGHTTLVTSLLMGVGWGMSALATPLAIIFFGMVSIPNAPMLEPWRINIAFALFASLMLIAGLLTLAIPRSLIQKAAAFH